MKIKKGDNVMVMAGKDRGKTGKVLQVFPVEGKVVVEGVNATVKHAKTRKQGEKGQKIEYNGPINASNVMLVDKSGKPTRVGYKVLEDGRKVRVMKKSGETIE
ncbi:MAG: 50S ribosomal protein L24 [Patescibacteria group bacterium]|nr:MAG: 50S ribosomal protein L24 [Patescibacteria group bacterium]